MEAKATLKNISRILNISISTVSRALKNHPDISDITKKKVQETAALLDYEPNTFAISLRTDKSNLIGVIVPFISNYFYQSFIAAVEEEAKKNNYSLLILQSADRPETELENIRICRVNRVAAIFVCISPHTKDISPFLRLSKNETPVIFFDKVPAFEACDKVCVADEQAAILAAELIIGKKKKKVLGIFGNPSLSITQKRLNAFTEIFKKNNYLSRLEIIHAESAEEARKEVMRICKLKSRPDVIFSMSDEILFGIIKAIQVLKVKIPDEIALITISNDGFIPKLFEPEITYIETSGYDLGKLTFKRMKDYQAGKTFIQEVLLPPKLVSGKSI
jgi:LacI family transcriptional regulator